MNDTMCQARADLGDFAADVHFVLVFQHSGALVCPVYIQWIY